MLFNLVLWLLQPWKFPYNVSAYNGVDINKDFFIDGELLHAPNIRLSFLLNFLEVS